MSSQPINSNKAVFSSPEKIYAISGMANTLPALFAVLLIPMNSASAKFTPDFQLKPDNITVLMAVDAELSEGLERVSLSGHGKFQVKSWSRPDQFASWKISTPEAAAYEAYVLIKRPSNRPLKLDLAVGDAAVTADLPSNRYNWQRVKLEGLLTLPAGQSTLTLRLAPASGKGLFSAEVHAVELVRPEVREDLEKRALAVRSNTKWFQEARYGMMVHWTRQSMPLEGDQKPYAEAVANFDVEKFSDEMAATGAGFVVLTTSHAYQYFPGPNQALDAILPGRTTERDLPAELAAALKKRGMKLFLYFHVGAENDPEWLKASGFWETDTTKFFNTIEAILTEAGKRYGDSLAGWWFDDGATNLYYRSAPWEVLARAAKAGNPSRLISFNAWELNNPTQFHDFCTGESVYDPRGIDRLLTPQDKGFYPSGTHAGLQASANLISDTDWVHTKRDTPPSGPRWTVDQLTKLLREFIANKNVPIFNIAITQDGEVSPETIALFREAGKAVP